MQEFVDIFGCLVPFVEEWGYLAVFLGSMVEGESIIIIAGFFAHEGILSLPKIIVISFIGTLFADQALYYVGRKYGIHFIDKYPSLKYRADKAFGLLKRYQNSFILSFRFIWGIRVISPIIIGSSGVTVKRFTILNVLAALIWSVGSCVGAYYFAHLILEYLILFPRILFGVVAAAALIIVVYKVWQKRKLQIEE